MFQPLAFNGEWFCNYTEKEKKLENNRLHRKKQH